MSTELQKHIKTLRGRIWPYASELERIVEIVCAAAERCEAAEKQALELSVKLTEAEALAAELRSALRHLEHNARVSGAEMGLALDVARDALAKTPADIGKELAELREDKARLDWLESTQTSIGFNVECCAWGVCFEAPYKDTIRGAIDAERVEGVK